MSAGRKKLLALLFLLVLLLGPARPAAAHAVPVRTVPAANAILEESPTSILIEFNEPVVADLSRITVLSQAGQAVASGAVEVADAVSSALSISLPPLNQGTYLVSWQVLSAVDGHTTSGTFSFGVGVTALAAMAGAATTEAVLSPLNAAARWLNLSGLALLIGLLVFRFAVWLPAGMGQDEVLTGRVTGTSLRLAWIGIGLLVLALLLTIVDQGGRYELLAGGNLAVWLGTRFGWVWLMRLVLTGLAAGAVYLLQRVPAATGRRQLWVGLGALLLLLSVATSLVSHSAALLTGAAAAMTIDLVHLAGASIWTGSLLSLALSLSALRTLPDAERGRASLALNVHYSVSAAAAVGALAVSGGFLAGKHVATWPALFGTTYGQILLVKLAVAAVVMVLGAVNLFYVKPRLKAADGAVVDRFRRPVRLEAGLALLLLALTGALTDAQRGADAPLLAADPGRTDVTTDVDDLTIGLTIEPAILGSNTFDVRLVDADGQPVTADEVSLRFTFLEQSIGADEGLAEPIGEGVYRLEGSYISLIGGWQVEVAVRRPGAFDSFAPFRFDAGLAGAIQPESAGTGPVERLAKFLTLVNKGAVGAGMVLFGLIWLFVARRAARRPWQLAALLLVALIPFWYGGNALNTFFGKEFTPAKFATNPILPDSESINFGQSLYETNCISCHGPQGYGNGPAAVGLSPAPANFTDGHTNSHSDGDLYFWISRGVADSAMPAFTDLLSDEERWHLVNYVRRLSVQ